VYLNAFPLHSGPFAEPGPLGAANDRHQLYQHWARYSQWYKNQPLDLIRGYLGERIGMCT
jgi:hypothetical protein